MSNPDNEAAAKAADNAAINADNAAKTDLTQGVDAPLDDGTSTIPVKADPFDSRKALYAKQGSQRDRRIAQEAADNADVADAVRVMQEESGQGSSRNELDRGSHIDTNRNERDPNRQPSRVPAEAGQGGELALPERVKVKVLGEEFEVPREDIEDAGGLTAYQKDRAASIRLQRVAAEESRLKAERAEFDKLRASAGSQTPATPAGGTPAGAPIQKDGAGTGADVEARSAEIVAALYSGDPARGKVAIAQILAAQSAPVASLDPAEVARQAAEMLRQQDRQTPPARTRQDTVRDVEIDELNAMMAERFQDLLADPALKSKAVARFEQLRADPQNAGRRLVDLGRQAATEVKPHPRQAVVERKQQLPPVNRGSQGHRADAPAEKLSYFEQQRRARGLP